MGRPRLVLAAMAIVSPLLVFTLWACLLALHAATIAASRDRRVENRSPEPIWVTPVGPVGYGTRPLPHYPTRWPDYSRPPFGEVHIPAGETRRLVVDCDAEMDVGSCGLVIRNDTGDHRFLKLGVGDRIAIDDLDAIDRAGPSMVAAMTGPHRRVNFGVPAWVIITLGVAAPIALRWLIRHDRALQRAEGCGG